MAIERPDYTHAAGVFDVDVPTNTITPVTQTGFRAWLRDGVGIYRLQCDESIAYVESMCVPSLGLNQPGTIGAQVTTPGIVVVTTYDAFNNPIDVSQFRIEVMQLEAAEGPDGTIPAPPAPIPPGGLVTSVFGRIGDVIAVAGDYSSSEISNLSGVAGVTVTDALNALAAIGGGGLQSRTRLTAVGANNYTVPAGITLLLVEVAGGGGGSSGYSGGGGLEQGASPGGGGGGYALGLVAVTPGQIIPYVVGAGGLAGAVAGAGGVGGDSWFQANAGVNALLGAGGIGSGVMPVSGASRVTQGGAGGAAFAGANVIVNAIQGEEGGNAFRLFIAAANFSFCGGAGGRSQIGTGGAPGTANASQLGATPTIGFGGGAGGLTSFGGNDAGAAGRQGGIIVYEFS